MEAKGAEGANHQKRGKTADDKKETLIPLSLYSYLITVLFRHIFFSAFILISSSVHRPL